MTGRESLFASRITIEVRVNADPVPGWGNDPEDFVKLIQRNLDEQIPHYKPEVALSAKIAVPLSELGPLVTQVGEGTYDEEAHDEAR